MEGTIDPAAGNVSCILLPFLPSSRAYWWLGVLRGHMPWTSISENGTLDPNIPSAKACTRKVTAAKGKHWSTTRQSVACFVLKRVRIACKMHTFCMKVYFPGSKTKKHFRGRPRHSIRCRLYILLASDDPSLLLVLLCVPAD